MKEIAEELGLSRLTVSSVVNGRAHERGISPATVERVQGYLEKRGYVPSRQATALRSGKTDSVGILHCGHLYSHLIEAFNRITDLLTDGKRTMEIMVVPREMLLDGMKELLSRGISQLVWIRTDSHGPAPIDQAFFSYQTHVPTTIYNFAFGINAGEEDLLRRKIHLVGVDRIRAHEKLGSFLRQLGHRVLAMPELSAGSAPADFRSAVFEAQGFEVIRRRPGDVPTEQGPAQGEALATEIRFAVRERGATAACLHDDELAGYVIAELVRLGISVPEEVTVTGFDGLRIAAAFAKPLTTLRLPVEAMVKCVRNILNGKLKRRRHCFDAELIEAGTHAAPRQGAGPG